MLEVILEGLCCPEKQTRGIIVDPFCTNGRKKNTAVLNMVKRSHNLQLGGEIQRIAILILLNTPGVLHFTQE